MDGGRVPTRKRGGWGVGNFAQGKGLGLKRRGDKKTFSHDPPAKERLRRGGGRKI